MVYCQSNVYHQHSELSFDVDEILVKARELNAFQRPSKRDYKSFRNWFWNIKPLSYELEEQFIKRKEDLVSLRHGREWSGFDGFIESCIRKMHCPLTQVKWPSSYAIPLTDWWHRSCLRQKNCVRRPMMNASSTTHNHVLKN